MIIGYARVSTVGQATRGNSLKDQERIIHSNYPAIEVVSEAYSGAKEREKFNELLSRLQSGDTLVVTKLDRFCRKTKEGLEYIDMLMNKGVKVHILNMGLIEDTPMGRLIVTNLLAFAEFERSMILERTQAGKEVARAKEGYKEGRKAKEVDFEKIVEKTKRGMSIEAACKEVGICKKTYYNKLKSLSSEAMC